MPGLKTISVLVMMMVSLSLMGQVRVTGIVYDATNGESLPGTNIYIPDIQRGTVSDDQGEFRMRDFPKGKFKVRASFIGYETAIIDLHLEADTNLHIHLFPSSVQTEEIVITGGRPSAQHENAIKIENILAEEIAQKNSATLVGALTTTPGVNMISRGEGVISPVIRGLSTSNILFLNDGFRLENFQFSESHPYLVSESGIDRVEIIKGPASLLYGSDAIGGVINMIPAEPAMPGTISGQAGIRYHSNTEGLSGSLTVKGTHRKWYWGLSGSGSSHADYLQGDGEYVPNSRFGNSSFKTFAGRTGTRSSTRVAYEYQKQKLGMTEAESVLLIDNRGRKNEIWYQDLDHHFLSVRNKLFYDRWKLGLHASYQLSHRKLNGSEQTPEFNLVDMKLHTVLYEAKANLVTSDRSEFTLAIQGMSQFNRNGEAPEHVLPDFSVNDLSLFGMVQHDFNHRWYIQVGFRFDNRFIDVPEQEKPSHDHGGGHAGEEEEEVLQELERYYGNMSGSLGATYRITKDLLLRGNIAVAYRTPNIAELTQDGAHGVRYEQGNRNLESQRNYEADMSLHYHKNILMFDVSGFYNHISGYIHLAPTTDTADDGDRIYRYLQEDARLYGMEAIAEVHPLNWLTVMSSFSMVRGVQEDGVNLPFIPQDKLNLEVTSSWKGSRSVISYGLKMGASFILKQDRPSQYETETAGYSLLYASAGMTLKAGAQPIHLEIAADNILNRTYIDHLSLLKDLGYYNMGRNITLRLSIPFIVE